MRSFNSDSIPRPPDFALPQILAAGGSLDVEIGAGQGLHAIRYARQNPKRQLIAIERTHVRFQGLNQRHAHHQELKNLTVLHADAVSVFVHALADQSLDRVFLLYPNPYPKSKQANLRWHNMPFMSVIRQKLKFGGSLTLATNIESYAREAERQMQQEWSFTMESKELLPLDYDARTHFERKYLARGEKCWNLVFVKPPEANTITPCE